MFSRLNMDFCMADVTSKIFSVGIIWTTADVTSEGVSE
jgi:hypothetical protein